VISQTSYVYKVAQGCEIEADVYRPSGDAARPAILWLHGGALIFGHRGQIAPRQLERYLQAGYTLVSVDYRLAPETRLEAIIEDLQDAYAWLCAQGPRLFGVDPARVAVIGHSAGGYLALMSGFCVRPRPRALVSFYGYGDIGGHWYSRPDPFYSQQPAVSQKEAHQAVGGPARSHSSSPERFRFYLYCRQQGIWPREVSGHDPDAEPGWFKAYCPLYNVTADYPPTLLLHGDQDTDVPYEQSVLMDGKLERCGVAHELLTMAGQGHGFDVQGEGRQDPAVAAAFDRVLAFLRAYGV
jgi:acetyl esterase/lipase